MMNIKLTLGSITYDELINNYPRTMSKLYFEYLNSSTNYIVLFTITISVILISIGYMLIHRLNKQVINYKEVIFGGLGLIVVAYVTCNIIFYSGAFITDKRSNWEKNELTDYFNTLDITQVDTDNIISIDDFRWLGSDIPSSLTVTWLPDNSDTLMREDADISFNIDVDEPYITYIELERDIVTTNNYKLYSKGDFVNIKLNISPHHEVFKKSK